MNDQVQDTEATETEAPPEVEAADPKSVVIKAINPTKEEMVTLRESIAGNYNFNVDVKPVVFNFKKSKDKDTGIETSREAVELALPYPSIEGILAILEAEDDGKQLSLLQDAIEDVINSVAREILYDDTTLSAATFPVNKVSWEAIANMPKAQRRGGGIPKETWEDFGKDYGSVMPEATGKSVDQVANMVKILVSKLSNVKTNFAVLELAVEQLAIYADKSENIEDYTECVEFLLKKADVLLNVSPEDLLTNL